MLNSKIPLKNDEFLLLKEFIKQECGIVLGEEKAYLIESRLARLIYETGCKSFREFYYKAKNDDTKQLKIKIIDSITTNETLWFRDLKPWMVMRDILIPKYIDELRSGRKQRILVWSAASSTGQEAYSFAMLVDEALKKEPLVKKHQFEILATDISTSALYMAISGRYNHIVMSRGMLPGYIEKYFTESNGIYEISNEIKSMVSFKPFNLQSDFSCLPLFDLIFCRNVAIYFSAEFKGELFNKIHSQLLTEGHLFLGSTESLIGYSTEFEQLEYQKSIYYKPKSKGNTI
jgi:chemotaxis protein methyltransferase CheR